MFATRGLRWSGYHLVGTHSKKRGDAGTPRVWARLPIRGGIGPHAREGALRLDRADNRAAPHTTNERGRRSATGAQRGQWVGAACGIGTQPSFRSSPRRQARQRPLRGATHGCAGCSEIQAALGGPQCVSSGSTRTVLVQPASAWVLERRECDGAWPAAEPCRRRRSATLGPRTAERCRRGRDRTPGAVIGDAGVAT